MSNKVSAINEKIIYENNWYYPVIITETKITNGVYLLTGRRCSCVEGNYYGHALYYLAYGKHSRQLAIRRMIQNAENANWESYSYWVKSKIFKHCQEDNSLDYYDRLDLLRNLTGKFIY